MELLEAARTGPRSRCESLVRHLLDTDPAALAEVAAEVLSTPAAGDGYTDYLADLTADRMLEADPALFEIPVARALQACETSLSRFRLARALYRAFPDRYREQVLTAGREALDMEGLVSSETAPWLVREFGREVLPDLVDLMERFEMAGLRSAALEAAVETLGTEARPVVHAALGQAVEDLVLSAVAALERLGDRSADEAAATALSDLSRSAYHPTRVIAAMARRPGFEEDLWRLARHHEADVRAAAIRTLGPRAREAAEDLLRHKKPAERLLAVRVLAAGGHLEPLRAHSEEHDDVRDEILRALATTRLPATRAEVERRPGRPRPDWIGELPELLWAEGDAVGQTTVDHLLWRQLRSTGGLDPEAEDVVRLVQPSPDFAEALLDRWLAAGTPAKHRQVLALAAALGATRMEGLVHELADSKRTSLAEEAIRALALAGDEAALDRIGRRYEVKKPGLGEAAREAFAAAAERRGVSVEELGDRVVAEDADPREQAVRLEALMVAQHRWPPQAWRELYLGHPVLRSLAMRLVWIAGGRTFRPLEDLTMTDADDEEVPFPEDPVGIAHPLEVADRDAWRRHLGEHRVDPPFPQIDRPAPSLGDVTGRETPVRHALERAGWRRGCVESGAVLTFVRRFRDVEAHLAVEGLSFASRDPGRVTGLAFARPGWRGWGLPPEEWRVEPTPIAAAEVAATFPPPQQASAARSTNQIPHVGGDVG